MTEKQPMDPDFPYSLTIDLPLPSSRLAKAALRSLSVDTELSPLVQRSFSTISPTTPFYPSPPITTITTTTTTQSLSPFDQSELDITATAREKEKTILRTEYKATTNRMLRVAVNGFMESLSVVLGIMAELDVDVLDVDLEGERERVGDGGVEVGKK